MELLDFYLPIYIVVDVGFSYSPFLVSDMIINDFLFTFLNLSFKITY